MQAGLFTAYLKRRAEVFSERLNQNLSSLAVEQAGAAQVSRVVSLLDKVREHGLKQIRRIDVHRQPYGDEAIDKIRRHDEVAHSQ